MNKSLLLCSLVMVSVLVTGCAIGPADRNAEPNSIQRAKIISKNQYSIVVEHSEWGKPIAFRFAEEHCGSLGKVAVYQGGTMQIGPDITSAWKCQ
jgi:hypothetical protein